MMDQMDAADNSDMFKPISADPDAPMAIESLCVRCDENVSLLKILSCTEYFFLPYSQLFELVNHAFTPCENVVWNGFSLTDHCKREDMICPEYLLLVRFLGSK